MTELKPCPFCGETDIEIRKVTGFFDSQERGHIKKMNYILCCKCRVRTKEYSTQREAMEAWNRRL